MISEDNQGGDGRQEAWIGKAVEQIVCVWPRTAISERALERSEIAGVRGSGPLQTIGPLARCAAPSDTATLTGHAGRRTGFAQPRRRGGRVTAAQRVDSFVLG